MFGLTAEKLALIALIAVFIIGPQRLPAYASRLAKFARSARAFISDTKERLSDELGPDFDEIDWKKLDPRQYDPRRIIRSALEEDLDPPAARRAPASTPAAPAAATTKEES